MSRNGLRDFALDVLALVFLGVVGFTIGTGLYFFIVWLVS